MNKTFTISFNPELATVVEKEIHRKKFANTSEFFRHLVRTYYFGGDLLIETLPASHPETKLSKHRLRTEKFVPIKSVI